VIKEISNLLKQGGVASQYDLGGIWEIVVNIIHAFAAERNERNLARSAAKANPETDNLLDFPAI
jgi:hypothetical protein